MNKYLAILILIVLFSLKSINCFSDTIYYDDIPYIKHYERNLSLRAYYGRKYASLNIEHDSKDSLQSSPIQYSPNSPLIVGIDGGYKNYKFGFGLKIPQSKSNIEKYGETKYTDVAVSFYSRRLGGDIFYQKYEAYYLTSPEKFDSLCPDSLPHPQNDMSISSLTMNLFYIHNPAFSLKATFGHTERQIKSRGSFMFMISARNSTIFKEYSLIPQSQKEYFPKLKNLRSGRFLTVSFAPGYGHNIKINDFFFSISGFTGFGSQLQNYNLIDYNEMRMRTVLKYSFRGAIGYNSDRIYVGLSFYIDSNTIPIDNVNLGIVKYEWKLSTGFRI